MTKKVNVRWFDGYLESFECSEVRFGSDLLWMRLLNGGNRHIPLRHVRWFSLDPESHENKELYHKREEKLYHKRDETIENP